MHIERRTTFIKGIASTIVMAILFMLALTPLHAQTRPGATAGAAPAKIRHAIETARFGASMMRKQPSRAPQALQGQMRPATRGMWIAVGVVAGIVGGAYAGAFLEGDSCTCDDPGLKGLMIGMPIGGVLGGIAAWRLTR